ncbi:sulfite reductase subunit alpha [Actomonas aquatica]|uniref:Sulfite reductase subunit alpha n=1 Tax=Actomonas aquatica TaxID=2866162 RepID=A0ABZ1CB97_9BACT|nr:sulfite reductase subunit alpha [Opitutus sp. WL0086]WRQ88962.1 sulfite reductase subunit alpha [Opitutus sp. WL0086]
MSAPEADSAYSKTNPFPARIIENRVLNQPGSAKETRHFVVDISGSGLSYTAGDSLGVFPSNRPVEVAEVLEAIHASGGELVSPAMLKLETPITLREALSDRLALASPTPKLMKALAEKATDAAEKAKLDELLAPESKEVLRTYLEERHYIDVLQEFPKTRLSPQELVDQMRKLMPRLYSIASSPAVSPQGVHLTVAIVRYESNHRERVGVASTFMADRAIVSETPVPVFVSSSHFGLPEDHAERDVIMVGPGTGIAPFRAFVQERDAVGAKGRNWVYFGDQHAATDFLYEDEWKDYVAKGSVTKLDLAWSRDQEQKVYVQDKMRENAAEMWEWLQNGALFYVCGDAKRMAKDVDQALHDIAAEQGKMSVEDAAEWVKQLKKDKRYQRDVY